MKSDTATHKLLSPIQPLNIIAALTKHLYSTASLWATRYRTRKQLAKLSEKQRSDVGVTSEQAKQESKKPFWR